MITILYNQLPASRINREHGNETASCGHTFNNHSDSLNNSSKCDIVTPEKSHFFFALLTAPIYLFVYLAYGEVTLARRLWYFAITK